jgi:hypothetical protein
MIEPSMIRAINHQRSPLILDIQQLDHFVCSTIRLALPLQLLKVEFGHSKDAPRAAIGSCELGFGAHS